MGTSISIMILVLHIDPAYKSINCFYINILDNLPLFTCLNSWQELQANF